MLAPRDAKALLELRTADGEPRFRITVERSDTRIYKDADYAEAGCVGSSVWRLSVLGARVGLCCLCEGVCLCVGSFERCEANALSAASHCHFRSTGVQLLIAVRVYAVFRSGLCMCVCVRVRQVRTGGVWRLGERCAGGGGGGGRACAAGAF